MAYPFFEILESEGTLRFGDTSIHLFNTIVASRSISANYVTVLSEGVQVSFPAAV